MSHAACGKVLTKTPACLLGFCGPHLLSIPRNPCSETPLLAAARRGNQECVELLLAAGAAADSANRGGLTPLMAASLFCHETVAAALLARCGGKKRQRGRRAWGVSGGVLYFWQVDGRAAAGEAPAAHPHAPSLLAACRGAGVSARDLTHRRTPLHWAAVADAAGVARRLLDSGADVAAVDVQVLCVRVCVAWWFLTVKTCVAPCESVGAWQCRPVCETPSHLHADCASWRAASSCRQPAARPPTANHCAGRNCGGPGRGVREHPGDPGVPQPRAALTWPCRRPAADGDAEPCRCGLCS